MELKTILLSKEDGVATIILNRPDRLNALNQQMINELNLAIDEMAEDDGVRVLVISGAGRGFCAGADLDFLSSIGDSATEARKEMSAVHSIPLKLRALPKPVIASVNGAAAGAGANLALACDLIIASEKARFGQVFVNVGLHVDTGGTHFLPWAVGVPKAMELMMTGDLIDAKEAERIGLINRVVPPEELEKATKELAEKLANGPAAVFVALKTSVYQGLTMNLSAALEREADCQSIFMNSEDNREGVKAVLEGRKPIFRGR